MDGGAIPLEAWFWQMPTCTRWWTLATMLTSALVQCQVVTPFQLFYSFRAVFVKRQVSSPPPLPYKLQISQVDHEALCARAERADTCHAVLAFGDNIPLLWTILSRPSLPRILPPALFTASRRIVRSIASPLLLAATILHGLLDPHVSTRLDAFPRPAALINTRVHLVQTEPGYETEFPWPLGVHCAVPALGPHGLQLGHERNDSERRDHGRGNWPCVVLLHGCLPSSAQRLSTP
jgi:hypothetical protein